MPSLARAVKWYLKGLFPLPIYVPLLIVVGASQYASLTLLKNPSSFYILTQTLFAPIITLTVSSHFYKNRHQTVFELSLLASWRNLALAKTIVYAAGIAPFIALEAALLWATATLSALTPLLATAYIYMAYSIASSLAPTQQTAFIADLIFVLLIPIAAITLLGNLLQAHIASGPTLGLILYLVTPLAAYQYYGAGTVSVNPNIGLPAATATATIIIAAYIYAFQRQEFKP